MTTSAKFTHERRGDIARVQVGRDLGFRNAAAFKAHCQGLLATGVQKLVLDFSTTEVMDSTGLGALFSLYRSIQPNRGQIAIYQPSSSVQVVMRVTRAYKIFPTWTEAWD